MNNFNANQFRAMYDKMGINIDKLGCVMLDVDVNEIPNIVYPLLLHYSSNPDRFWIKGFVAGHTPHVTLLYGLLQSANSVYRSEVDEVLKGWNIDSVEVDHVGYFSSPYADEEYYCIVAHVKITSQLLEGHQRLELLPHINTFTDYKAHITIAYIEKNDQLLEKTVQGYDALLRGTTLKISSLNYGK